MFIFRNKVIGKKELKILVHWVFTNYGVTKASQMSDQLKSIGFYFATKAGLSLSLEDLRVPQAKKELLKNANQEINLAEEKYSLGEITFVERFQRVINTWNETSQRLKDEVIQYFDESDPLNSIHIMAFSGARGNISQVRQLVGMRGLMSDPHGQIIDLPIKSNFREGLNVTEYIISSYGARKGLVDTALRTADSGYLTRRLVDVAQDIIVREMDCKTSEGIALTDMLQDNNVIVPLKKRLIGRTLLEDVFDPISESLIGKANETINPDLANKIASVKDSVMVRSPLTCDSSRSVCQLCYGWSLAYGKLVDLGDAVGIIAAQSIGEPGTQLTMRTFHTGGVFNSEVDEQIVSPHDGIVVFDMEPNGSAIRTPVGNSGIQLKSDFTLIVQGDNSIKTPITLKSRSILFVLPNQHIKKGGIIAEVPQSSSLIVEKATKDIMSSFSGKVNFGNLLVEESVTNQGRSTRINRKTDVLWLLGGEVYELPSDAIITNKLGHNIRKDTALATTKIFTRFGGQAKVFSDPAKVEVLVASLSLNNAFVDKKVSKFQDKKFLQIDNEKKFLLNVEDGDKLSNFHVIGSLLDESYTTPVGGIIKYPGSQYLDSNSNLGKDFTSNDFILWIPEETHTLNVDSSSLLIENNELVPKDTFITKDLCCSSSGLVNIVEENDLVNEVVIKPGNLYPINSVEEGLARDNTFVEPECEIISGVHTDKLVYIEFLENSSGLFLLVRPVIFYEMPSRSNIIEQSYIPSHIKDLCLKIVNFIPFKDGQKVKSNTSITLVKTDLILEIEDSIADLDIEVNFIDNVIENDKLKFQISVKELLTIDKALRSVDKMDAKPGLLINDNQLIKPFTCVMQVEVLSKASGDLASVDDKLSLAKRILLVSDLDKKGLLVKKGLSELSIGDIICTKNGSHIGQLISMNNENYTIRRVHPFLISKAAILFVNHGQLIQQGTKIASLIFERPKTGDIVQGLPKIEEILEARKSKEFCKLATRPGTVNISYEDNTPVELVIYGDGDSFISYTLKPNQNVIVANKSFVEIGQRLTDGPINPHNMLSVFFKFYKKSFDLPKAVRLSFQKVQFFLVQEIQAVYQSQGVGISDKHIEIVVSQMTSKVKVEDGGDTTLLPDELIGFQQIKRINDAIISKNRLPALYSPIILGITKASLNTDSFISAASFQETTRVLTQAAIEGKTDWLHGLKENVIVGRLIPSGTGFSKRDSRSKRVSSYSRIKDSSVSSSILPGKVKETNFEDIILDHRTIY